MHKITHCRVCHSNKLITIIELGELYLSDYVEDKRKPKKYPLTLLLCEHCYLVQLQHSAPQSELYTENYGYLSGINNTMKNELKDIVANAMHKYPSNTNDLTVIDIGANDGTLLEYYPKNYHKIGIEPIKKLAEMCNVKANTVINDFFNHDSIIKKLGNIEVDIITAISCFYDIEDPNIFIKDVKKLLKKEGVFIIQQNYLVTMLEQNAFDNIVHEHLEYYSLTSLQYLLDIHDLEIFDVELRNLNGGSIRTYICNKNTKEISPRVSDLLKKEKEINLKNTKIYTEFAQRIHRLKEDVYTFIANENKKGKKIYVYGASTRGNTLLQYFGLDNRLIEKAVERNSEKWEKYISSLAIPIIAEEQARKEKPDYMLVLPWFFKDEFLKREKKYLESGGHFIFPLPHLDVI